MVFETLTDGIRILQIMRRENRRKRQQRRVRRSQGQRPGSDSERGSLPEHFEIGSARHLQQQPQRDDLDMTQSSTRRDLMSRSSSSSSLSSLSSSSSSAAPAPAFHCGSIPPASTSAIVNLLHLRLRSVPKREQTVAPEHNEDGSEDDSAAGSAEDGLTCVICSEDLHDGCIVTRLPCGHLYHAECVVPWLARTCTCPTCRYELPTDCPHFEVGRRQRMKGREMEDDSGASGAGNEAGNHESAHEQEECGASAICPSTDDASREHLPVPDCLDDNDDGTSIASASSSAAVAAQKACRSDEPDTKKTRTVRAWCGSVVVRLTMQE